MKSMKRVETTSLQLAINNQFAIDYINITMRHIDKSDPNQRFTKNREVDNTIPFLIIEGKLLCRSPIKEMLDIYGNDDGAGGYKRLKTFVDMINVGLSLMMTNVSTTTISDLPLLFMTGDSHGCDVPTKREVFRFNRSELLLDLNINYPRLSWAIPAPKYNQDGWCHAIGVPGYQMWLDYKDETHSSWERTFSKQAKQYPWSKKKNKAVWRGSTTSHSSYQSNHLSDIPRGQLVETSISHPHLIDAAFKSFDVVWRDRKEELMKTTIVKEEMKFDVFMDYKAIIDIDGNNWRYVLCVHMIHILHTQSTNHLVFSVSSSRFPKLLCTNSVVIKVDPWYGEYFYEELKPWVHYIPASLSNIINITEYVLDKNNEDEMQSIISSANAWCQNKITREGMTRDMMKQIHKYTLALDTYLDEHKYSRAMLMDTLNDLDLSSDLVECKCKSPMATKFKLSQWLNI